MAFMSTQKIQTARAATPAPPEVSGWLLLLCIILTLLYPVTGFYGIVTHTIPMLMSAHQANRVLLLSVYLVIFSAVAIMSFIAGLKLWTLKPGAVRFVRRYLVTYLTVNIAYFVFWIVVIRPNQSLSFAEMAWDHVALPIASTALWYFYLDHSKRVHATYAAE
jgi:hypothetical protein